MNEYALVSQMDSRLTYIHYLTWSVLILHRFYFCETNVKIERWSFTTRRSISLVKRHTIWLIFGTESAKSGSHGTCRLWIQLQAALAGVPAPRYPPHDTNKTPTAHSWPISKPINKSWNVVYPLQFLINPNIFVVPTSTAFHVHCRRGKLMSK